MWEINLKTLRKMPLTLLLMIICLTILSLFIGVFQTEMLRRITESILEGNRGRLYESFSIFIMGIIINFIVNLISRRSSFFIEKRLTFDCENRLFSQFFDWEYVQENQKISILAQVRKNIRETTILFMQNFINTYQMFLIIAFGIIYGISINPLVVVISAVIALLMVLIMSKPISNMSALNDEVIRRNEKLHSLLWEQIDNKEIAPFLNQERVLQGYAKESQDFLKTMLIIKKKYNASMLFASFGTTIMILVVSLVGGKMVMGSQLELSDVMALIILMPIVSSKMFEVPNQTASWKQVRGQYISYLELLDVKKIDMRLKEEVGDKIKRIEIEDLSLNYPDKGENVLRHVNLSLEKGLYGLAGKSGSGKSTLIQVLASMLPYKSGSIMINGRPLNLLEREKYWQKLSYVQQNSTILPGSFLYNVTLLENGDFDKERLEKSIQDACLEEWLATKTEGVETFISQESVSKGEAQRINLARAYYRQSELLLLDESTSALDPAIEHRVIKALKRRVEEEQLIALFISHSPVVLEGVREIVFIKEGKVQAIDSHRSLLDNNSHYRELLKEVE